MTVPRTISKSVGLKGVNRSADVKTVQQLLNGVPANEGRPKPKLVEDSLCGNKTINAIHRFQLKHFGWKGADGRVDPGHRTINKLNSLNQFEPPVPIHRTGQFMFQSIREGPFLNSGDENDWFFLISDARSSAVYFFTIFHRGAGGPKGPVNNNVPIPKAADFQTPAVILKTAPMLMNVDEFDCFAHYESRLAFRADKEDPRNYTSKFTLELVPPDDSPVSLESIKRVFVNVHVKSSTSRVFFGHRLVLVRRADGSRP